MGLFCLTFDDDGLIRYQGQVVAHLDEGSYLLQWFSALDGAPTDCQIATIDEMRTKGWKFYRDDDDWREAYQKESQRSAAQTERTR